MDGLGIVYAPVAGIRGVGLGDLDDSLPCSDKLAKAGIRILCDGLAAFHGVLGSGFDKLKLERTQIRNIVAGAGHMDAQAFGIQVVDLPREIADKLDVSALDFKAAFDRLVVDLIHAFALVVELEYLLDRGGKLGNGAAGFTIEREVANAIQVLTAGLVGDLTAAIGIGECSLEHAVIGCDR